MFLSTNIQSKVNVMINNLVITQRRLFQQGFTIIELMVTVAIIAILSGISITGYQYFRDRAEYSTLRLEAERLRKQVDICFNLGNRGAHCQSAADASAHQATPLSAPPAVTAANDVIGLNVVWKAGTPATGTTSATGGNYTITATEPTNSTLAGDTTSTYVVVGRVNNATGNITWTSTCTPGNLC